MTHKRKIQFSIAGYFIGAGILFLSPLAGFSVMASALVSFWVLYASKPSQTENALTSIGNDIYDFFTGRSWAKRKVDNVVTAGNTFINDLTGTPKPSYFTTFAAGVSDTLDSVKESITTCFSSKRHKK